MRYNRQEITPKVVEILNRVSTQPENYTEENFSKPLTGALFGFSEYDMTFLVLELMEEFGITFVKEDFEDYRFNTINNILEIITSKEIRTA